MNKDLKRIKTDAGVERAWVDALSDEEIVFPMQTKQSKIQLENSGNDTDVMMSIARSKIMGFIAEEGDCL